MKTKLILVVLLVLVAKFLYDAGAPRAGEGGGEPALASLSLGGRMLHGVGMVGSQLAAPTVHGMVLDHTAQLSALDPVLRKMPPVRRQRANGVMQRVEELDSMAVARLGVGRPVAALKYAIQAGGLVDAVRERVQAHALVY
jgi:hypothetical protein